MITAIKIFYGGCFETVVWFSLKKTLKWYHIAIPLATEGQKTEDDHRHKSVDVHHLVRIPLSLSMVPYEQKLRRTRCLSGPVLR